MDKTNWPQLANFPTSAKVLASCFLFSILLGYSVALLKVYEVSHYQKEETVLHYRGEPEDEESIHLPQSYNTMLSVSHVHTLSQPMLLILYGIIFIFSSAREATKTILIGSSFGASFISNLMPWLLKHVSGELFIIYPLTQTIMGLSLLAMTWISLKDMWKPK